MLILFLSTTKETDHCKPQEAPSKTPESKLNRDRTTVMMQDLLVLYSTTVSVLDTVVSRCPLYMIRLSIWPNSPPTFETQSEVGAYVLAAGLMTSFSRLRPHLVTSLKTTWLPLGLLCRRNVPFSKSVPM